MNSSNSNRCTSTSQSTQNDNDNSYPRVSNSSTSGDEKGDNEQALEKAPIIARVHSVKPPEDYQWTDGKVIFAVILDTGDILTKITW